MRKFLAFLLLLTMLVPGAIAEQDVDVTIEIPVEEARFDGAGAGRSVAYGNGRRRMGALGAFGRAILSIVNHAKQKVKKPCRSPNASF